MNTPHWTWREWLRKSWSESRGAWVLVAVLLAGVTFGSFYLRARNSPALSSQFSETWVVYTFRPDVSATSYDSKSGNATIIWVSGMDNEDTPGGTYSF